MSHNMFAILSTLEAIGYEVVSCAPVEHTKALQITILPTNSEDGSERLAEIIAKELKAIHP